MTDYDKTGRDAVAGLLAKGADAAAVARQVCTLVSRAAHAAPDAQTAVTAAVRGGMGAVVLGGQDLAEAALAVLDGLTEVSLVSRVGPDQVMSWALEGIAAVATVAGPDAQAAVATKIEERFMGAGEVFAALCEKARAKGAP